jgi:hypothetical protein
MPSLVAYNYSATDMWVGSIKSGFFRLFTVTTPFVITSVRVFIQPVGEKETGIQQTSLMIYKTAFLGNPGSGTLLDTSTNYIDPQALNSDGEWVEFYFSPGVEVTLENTSLCFSVESNTVDAMRYNIAGDYTAEMGDDYIFFIDDDLIWHNVYTADCVYEVYGNYREPTWSVIIGGG